MGLSKWFSCRIQERGRGKLSKACQAKALEKAFRCRKAETAVGTCEFLHKLEIAHFDDEPALVGIEKLVDFRLIDRLLKAMQASTSSAAGVRPRLPLEVPCSLKYAPSALFWTSVVRSETTPLRIRN
jgi:hypothetical protein